MLDKECFLGVWVQVSPKPGGFGAKGKPTEAHVTGVKLLSSAELPPSLVKLQSSADLPPSAVVRLQSSASPSPPRPTAKEPALYPRIPGRYSTNL